MLLFVVSSTLYAFRSIFLYNATATTEIYTLSLHDALPISPRWHPESAVGVVLGSEGYPGSPRTGHAISGLSDAAACRSEEHTSELQSHSDLVCRLLLEKKKKKKNTPSPHI